VHIIIPALTYNGSVLDTTLNTVVLVILIAALAAQKRSPWWITFVAMVALQVVLWFALEAAGISVVWSGLAGAALVELGAGRTSSRHTVASDRPPAAIITAPTRRRLLIAAAVVAMAAIVYYAVALPPISTVAHLLALLVGAGIHTVARGISRRSASRQNPDSMGTTEPLAPFRLPNRIHKQMLEKWPEYYGYDDELHYGIWGDAGLLITREKDGYRVDRRADRSNYYDQFRFRTPSFRKMTRRLLQE
jgi:hypothetical protein